MAPAAHGLGHDRLHARQFLRRGGAFIGLFPHDVHPDGGVPDVTPVVERRAASLDGVEILREGLELVPGNAGRQGVEAHVLHVLKGAGEERDELGSDRCDGEAAVAGDDARDTVERRGGEPRVPEHLGVVVGVDVDEPRGHDLTRGVELPIPSEAFPHADDAPFGHSHVGRPGGSPCPVDQRTSTDHDVAVHGRLLGSKLPGRRTSDDTTASSQTGRRRARSGPCRAPSTPRTGGTTPRTRPPPQCAPGPAGATASRPRARASGSRRGHDRPCTRRRRRGRDRSRTTHRARGGRRRRRRSRRAGRSARACALW